VLRYCATLRQAGSDFVTIKKKVTAQKSSDFLLLNIIVNGCKFRCRRKHYAFLFMHRLTTLCKTLRVTRLTRGVSVRSMAYSCDFEVEGRVQGVFFRACTEKKAKELGLVGWVMNTPQGTVKGVCQSKDKNSLDQMKVGVKKKIIVSFLVLWF